MKLKCSDGVVRSFSIASYNELFGDYTEARCNLCGELFGVHDTHILKPRFKQHRCSNKSVEGCGGEG